MIATYVDTPYFVLLDGKQRLGPAVVPFTSGAECSVVYGFSDKDFYNKFCANSELALKPYPLTKFYLRNHTTAPSDGVNLVVIDAGGPHEPYLHAVTMEAVLQGHENHTPHVTATYELTFAPEVAAYRIAVNRSLKAGNRR